MALLYQLSASKTNETSAEEQIGMLEQCSKMLVGNIGLCFEVVFSSWLVGVPLLPLFKGHPNQVLLANYLTPKVL